MLTANLVVSKDGSYRIALNDVDGLSNDGDTEYFIRMLNDRPPDVRILRPAGDKKVSPLEEVPIEARADDDYGVRSLELVIKSAGGKEKVVPIDSRPPRIATDARSGGRGRWRHTVFLEDLSVKPGDVVTYYARATDVGRGRRSTESRSDIFFLEVKPYEEEFVASEGQSGGGGRAADRARRVDRAAERHHGRDLEARCARAAWRRRRAVGAGHPARSRRRRIGLKNKTAEVAAMMAGNIAAQRRRQGPRGAA